jgi:hypothetical protein
MLAVIEASLVTQPAAAVRSVADVLAAELARLRFPISEICGSSCPRTNSTSSRAASSVKTAAMTLGLLRAASRSAAAAALVAGTGAAGCRRAGGTCGGAGARLYRHLVARKYSDAVPALLPMPDRVITGCLDCALGEFLVLRLQLLKADDVRLGFGDPARLFSDPIKNAASPQLSGVLARSNWAARSPEDGRW